MVVTGLLSLALLAAWGYRDALLAQVRATQDRAPLDPSTICAKVDDHAIRYADVMRERDRQVKVKKIGASELAVLDGKIRDQLIERALVLAALTRLGKVASRSDVDFELNRWKQELSSQGTSLAEYLAEQQMTEADLRREILWRTSWSRYTAEYVTEANLEKYFREHASDYDGRKLRIAQILFKTPPDGAADDRKALVAKASQLREEIVSQKRTFADAAKSESQSPSAKQGGELGWIERHEPMDEAFSKAAFALKVGETSPPVESPFGIHLIHCLEVEPGKKTWRDVRRELERDVSAFLAKWLADTQRSMSRIERPDVLPSPIGDRKEHVPK